MAQSNAATAVQNLFKTPELKEKILFTLLALLVYRIGAAVTAPGINPQAIADFIDSQKNGGGLLGLYNLFTGGQLARATVFALGIMPYISASIFQQIAQAVIPTVDKMSKDEEAGKRSTSGRATRPSGWRRCRRMASRSSPSRCRLRSRIRGSASACR